MKHELPQLPFAKEALEPHMSRETLEYHYGKHHKAYVDKLNQQIVGTQFENSSLEEIIRRAEGPIFNNAAQAWNHTFFWKCLTPARGTEQSGPQGELRKAIENSFGSVSEFQEAFTKKSVELFGSGWAWLVRKGDKLEILQTSNAMTPIRDGIMPLLTCDVWEHAYYIDYRNERAKFLKAFFSLASWEFAAKQYVEASAAR